MREIVLTLIATVMLFGCHNEPTPVAPDEQKAIGFGNVDTRAGLNELKDHGFGVWAIVNNDTMADYILMDNCEVTFDTTTSKWGYSPVQYWIANSLFTFVATYPYDENGTYYSYNSTDKAVKLTVDETPSAIDFLIANNLTDTSEDYATTVDLDFQHALTNVSLNIWREGVKHGNDQMRVRKVTLSNIRMKGTGTFPTDTNSNTWVYTNDKLTLSYTNDEVADNDNIGAAVVVNDTYTFGGVASTPFSEVMLLPQTIDASNSVALRIEYELKRNNAADWESAELETVLPSMTWNSGQRYTYNVVLSSVTDITVYYIQTKVDPWGTPQVGGTVIIK